MTDESFNPEELLLMLAAMDEDEQQVLLANLTVDEIMALNGAMDRLEARTGGSEAIDLLPHQIAPWKDHPDALGWVLSGGRGAGKTMGAAIDFIKHAHGPACDPRLPGGHRMLIVGPTQTAAVDSCVNGPSGLTTLDPTTVLRSGKEGTLVRWEHGAVARLAGADTKSDVDDLRSKGNNCRVWCEEVAAWKMLVPKKLDPVGDRNAMVHIRMGLRTGPKPRFVASTTPKNRPEIAALYADEDVVVTKAPTEDNPHLPEHIKKALYARHGGTRLGQQELGGVLLTDVEGALFPSSALDAHRMGVEAIGLAHDRPGVSGDGTSLGLLQAPGGVNPDENQIKSWALDDEAYGDGPIDPTTGRRMQKALGDALRWVSTGVDPSGGATETGIVAVALVGGARRPLGREPREGESPWRWVGCPCDLGQGKYEHPVAGPQHPHLWVIVDGTIDGKTSVGSWADRSIDVWRAWNCDSMAAEKNYGGAMVAETISNAHGGAGSLVNVELVSATRGKDVRAEPYSRMAEQGRFHIVGLNRMVGLEAELTGWDGVSVGALSPNRLDAMVWAAKDCMDKHLRDVEAWASGQWLGTGAMAVPGQVEEEDEEEDEEGSVKTETPVKTVGGPMRGSLSTGPQSMMGGHRRINRRGW